MGDHMILSNDDLREHLITLDLYGQGVIDINQINNLNNTFLICALLNEPVDESLVHRILAVKDMNNNPLININAVEDNFYQSAISILLSNKFANKQQLRNRLLKAIVNLEDNNNQKILNRHCDNGRHPILWQALASNDIEAFSILLSATDIDNQPAFNINERLNKTTLLEYVMGLPAPHNLKSTIVELIIQNGGLTSRIAKRNRERIKANYKIDMNAQNLEIQAIRLKLESELKLELELESIKDHVSSINSMTLTLSDLTSFAEISEKIMKLVSGFSSSTDALSTILSEFNIHLDSPAISLTKTNVFERLLNQLAEQFDNSNQSTQAVIKHLDSLPEPPTHMPIRNKLSQLSLQLSSDTTFSKLLTAGPVNELEQLRTEIKAAISAYIVESLTEKSFLKADRAASARRLANMNHVLSIINAENTNPATIQNELNLFFTSREFKKQTGFGLGRSLLKDKVLAVISENQQPAIINSNLNP